MTSTGGSSLFSPLFQDLIVASFPFTSIFGALLVAHVADTLGRRLCLLLSSLLFLLGLLLQLLSPLSLPLFLAGRLVCGAAIGACLLLTPVFVSEVAPPDVRGALAGGWDGACSESPV